jgi:predicted dehydrogenase
MVEAARGAGVLLGVAQVFRFAESTRRFRERVGAGDTGTPVLARAEFLYPGLESPRKWITDPGLACGGPIADVGVHCIDALRFILQDEVTGVSTRAVSDEYSGSFESSAVLSLDFESGVLATVTVSTRSEYRTVLEVTGTEGKLVAHDALNVERPVTIELRKGPHSEIHEEEEVSNRLAYARQVDAFAAAIEEGRDFEIPGEEGLSNQLILDAAFRSRESGRVETVG